MPHFGLICPYPPHLLAHTALPVDRSIHPRTALRPQLGSEPETDGSCAADTSDRPDHGGGGVPVPHAQEVGDSDPARKQRPSPSLPTLLEVEPSRVAGVASPQPTAMVPGELGRGVGRPSQHGGPRAIWTARSEPTVTATTFAASTGTSSEGPPSLTGEVPVRPTTLVPQAAPSPLVALPVPRAVPGAPAPPGGCGTVTGQLELPQAPSGSESAPPRSSSTEAAGRPSTGGTGSMGRTDRILLMQHSMQGGLAGGHGARPL